MKSPLLYTVKVQAMRALTLTCTILTSYSQEIEDQHFEILASWITYLGDGRKIFKSADLDRTRICVEAAEFRSQSGRISPVAYKIIP